MDSAFLIRGMEMCCLSKVIFFRLHFSLCGRATAHGAVSYFYFQLVLHNWCNNGLGRYYPVFRMMHTKQLFNANRKVKFIKWQQWVSSLAI